MIKYSCEISLSLDEASKRLTKAGVRHKVIGECVLGFRERPTRQAKEILTRCGFVREPDGDIRPATAEEVWGLEEKFS